MGGAQETLTAPTIEELKAKVEGWYEHADAAGLKEDRFSWDPETVIKTTDRFAFTVWAHT